MFTLEYKHRYKRLFNTLSGVPMSTAVPSVMSTVLEEAAKYIVKKVVEGKGLSDREVVILILDQVNKLSLIHI